METLKIADAAAALGIHANTLRRWADCGMVPSITLPSGHRRWTREQLDMIRERMHGPRAAAVAEVA